jgi:hypothetical protein
LLVAIALVGASCTSSGSGAKNTEPNGPPEIQGAVVAKHAGQFDDKLADRPAGSQQEFAATTYLLAHLQQAGYAPLLDPVPVENLVRSTNVVADPPRVQDPATIVAIPYDTTANAPSDGVSLGTWLELARALYAKNPDHSTGFVALGAEQTAVAGGRLGSRRLAEYLIDRGIHPLVISVGRLSTHGVEFTASGSGAASLLAVARKLGVGPPSAVPVNDPDVVFGTAGFEHVSVYGSVDGVGKVLLEALSSSAPGTASPR